MEIKKGKSEQILILLANQLKKKNATNNGHVFYFLSFLLRLSNLSYKEEILSP
jgi:hypothetical protein